MKLSYTEIVLVIIIAALLLIGIDSKTKREGNIGQEILFLQQHIKRIDSKGEEIVVVFSSGPVYSNNDEELYFRDKLLFRNIERELKERGYSTVFINTPCLSNGERCLEDFSRLALGISDLGPKAVIYKGIDSGIGSQAFSTIINKNNIPMYTIGTEVSIDTKGYVGPDNIKLGKEAYEGLRPLLKPGQTAVYVETVRLSNGDKLENGYPRINSARNYLTDAGIIEKKTLFTNWSKTQTYGEVLDLLDKQGPVDYIITPSTETAEGAVAAVTTAGYRGQITIVALDLTQRIVELIIEGDLYGGVPQQFLRQAEVIADMVDNNNDRGDKRLFAGKLVRKENLVDIDNLW